MSSSSVTVCGGSSWSEKADPWKTVPASHVGSFDYPMTNPSASLPYPSALLWAPLPFLSLTLPFASLLTRVTPLKYYFIYYLPSPSPQILHNFIILFLFNYIFILWGWWTKFLPTGAWLLTLSRVVAINWTCNAASLQLYFVVSGRE